MRLRAIIVPMLARPVEHFPAGRPGDYVYEPKLDGFRCLAMIDRDRGVHLQSRGGARFNDTFPEVVWAVFEHLPPGTVLDGEIVRWSPVGRLDFLALQQRNVAGRRAAEQLSRSQPCHYVVFDLLRLGGRDVTGQPLLARRALLEQVFTPVPAAGVLALSMQTIDEGEARSWYSQLHTAGVEGLMIKPARSRYEPGIRGWLKLKYRATVEGVVGGMTGKRRRPNELLLGRYDRTGRLRVVGRTSRLGADMAAQIAPLLTPARSGHPWPAELPPSWVGAAFGRRDPIIYTRVEPTLVVEVLADVATEYGRYRHPLRLIRPRTDIHPSQVTEAEDVEPLRQCLVLNVRHGTFLSRGAAEAAALTGWGAAEPRSFDCSGLTLRAYESAGTAIPWVAHGQWLRGPRIRDGNAQPGDLVFFDNGDGTADRVCIGPPPRRHDDPRAQTGLRGQDRPYGRTSVGFTRPGTS